MALIRDFSENGATGASAGARRWRRGPLAAIADTLDHERPRWFAWGTVSLGAGAAAYFQLAVEPTLWMALMPLLAALAVRLVLRGGTVGAALATAAIALALGLVLAKVRTEMVRAPVLERRLTAEVKGFVELVEPRPGRGGRLTVVVASIATLKPEKWPHHVRIRVLGDVSGFRPGDAVRVTATLSPPPAPALPGAYDFARAAWFARLGAVGYAMRPPVHDDTIADVSWRQRLQAGIERLRLAIGRRITAALPGETGAIANALITGERGGITEATNDAFRDSGLFHALSISGLHMAVMAGAIFWTLRLMLAAVPSLALRYPIKKWAAVGAALGALFYLLISGSAPATERSYLMISIMLLAILLDRSALALRNVALSAILLLLLFPESILDLGFQMSYAAVVALVAAHEEIQRRWPSGEGGHGFVSWLRSQGAVGRPLLALGAISLSTVIASLAVAPLGAFYFHKSQQYAILGNVLGLPICDLVVMPLALATLVAMPFGLEALPLWGMGLGIDAMVWCARFVAGLPGAVATVPAMPLPAFLLIVAGGIWLTLWQTRWRLLGLVAVAAGGALAPFGTRPDILVGRDAHTVAVRQGDRLSALPVKGNAFDLARWLEHDGDGRPPKAAATGHGFRCDAAGCTAMVRGLVVAVARSPDALADDCLRADIIVAELARPRSCNRPRLVLDRWDLWHGGAAAISIGREGQLTLATVEQARGKRPWSRTPPDRLHSRSLTAAGPAKPVQ